MRRKAAVIIPVLHFPRKLMSVVLQQHSLQIPLMENKSVRDFVLMHRQVWCCWVFLVVFGVFLSNKDVLLWINNLKVTLTEECW